MSTCYPIPCLYRFQLFTLLHHVMIQSENKMYKMFKQCSCIESVSGNVLATALQALAAGRVGAGDLGIRVRFGPVCHGLDEVR